MKTCSGNWKCCQYTSFGSGSYIYCQFSGYCAYQLPNDSRFIDDFNTQPIEELCVCAGSMGNDGNCPICGKLKYSRNGTTN